MGVHSDVFGIRTQGENDILDITGDVAASIARSGLKEGVACVFVSGSTGSITTIEYEPGLLEDLPDALERLVPKGMTYQHHLRWHDGNGHSHVRASLLGTSLVIPFNDKKLALGTWQQIVLVDFDNRPRSRQLILQIMGE